MYLFVNMLQRSVRVLAVADPMTSHARLTGVLFTFDQHLVIEFDVVDDREWVACRTTAGGRMTARKKEAPSR